ncbi:UDP-3-O-acyl-N-acetylglucosamine deacetylase [Rhabdochlamydiaceae symbiont of Dictyostelium giganteum]|uniref:UDP-3-O-acyl-N-acetylglucosamine deacetylase n=1 Tax=Rhabdochlamydiaceae symbiont of Dictyostelium giganteum TaxID=3342349 RepID=UPI00385126D9
MHSVKKKTIRKTITFSGQTLFTDQEVSVRLIPHLLGEGITFYRTDLPGSPSIPAKTEYVQEGMRTTQIGKEGVFLQTIEHFMAALAAFEIDQLSIEISGSEFPIFDGSALFFVKLLEEAGIQELAEDRLSYTLEEPCSVSLGDGYLIALPSDHLRFSYTLDYPNSPYLRTQYFNTYLTPQIFKEEIAPCRTFALYEEIAPLIERGFFKNGALEHGVVIQGDKLLNPEGARFSNEMVRHKVLDLIGDLALLGVSLKAHFIGVKTGHAANHLLAKKIGEKMRKSLRIYE